MTGDLVDLLAMPEDAFRSLVDEAVRGHPEDGKIQVVRERLLEEDVVERTYLTLIRMKKSVEGQLAAKRSDYVRDRNRARSNPEELRAVESRYQTWRAGALRFKSGTEAYMLAVRARRNTTPGENYYLAYQTLRQAIAEHKKSVLTSLELDEDTNADEVLWSVIEEG